MKPAWDSLAQEYASSDKVIVADVDCTAAGEPLCGKYGVEGFPTIKYFNPPDDEGEDYDGGRDLDSLKEFAKTLGPGCSASTLENCDALQKAELDAVIAMSEEDRTKELTELQESISKMEADHEALLKKLQAEYDESNTALEEYKKKSKPRVKLLKKAAGGKAAGSTPPKDEV
jgi:hypothetical protein